MKTFVIPQRELRAAYEADVVVCGGGTAGVFAAISAAESGKRVLIVEQFGSLGGSATNGLVTPLMHSHITDDPACSYISIRLREKLKAYGGVDVTGRAFDPTVLMVALEELCAEAGVQLLYHTFISDVLVENGTVKAIVAVNKSGTVVLRATSSSTAPATATFPCSPARSTPRGTPKPAKISRFRCATSSAAWTFRRWANSSRAKSNAPASPATAPIRRRFRSTPPAAVTAQLCPTFSSAPSLPGDLTVEDHLYWQMFNIPGRNDSIAFNNPEFFEDLDGTNPDTLTKTQVAGKKAIYRQLAFYKKYMKGFENAYIADIAAMVGIRESRNITTEYVLTGADLLSRKKFDDAFCQSNYPVDIHGYTLEFVSRFKPAEDARPYYEIPYGSLVVKGFENLLVAGRCLGAEFLAQSSLRIQPCCRSAGEAAGIAAALALDAKIPAREVDGRKVRKIMEDRGAVYAAV